MSSIAVPPILATLVGRIAVAVPARARPNFQELLLSRRPKVLQQALQPEVLRGHASLAARLLWRQRQEPFSCIVGQGAD